MKKLSHIISVSVLALFLLSGITHAQQWADPIQAAPYGNIFPPVNTGAVAQEKAGWLGSGNFYGDRRLGAVEIQAERFCLPPVGTMLVTGAIKNWTKGIGAGATDCITSWPVGGGGVPTTANKYDTLWWDYITQSWKVNMTADSGLHSNGTNVRVGSHVLASPNDGLPFTGIYDTTTFAQLPPGTPPGTPGTVNFDDFIFGVAGDSVFRGKTITTDNAKFLKKVEVNSIPVSTQSAQGVFQINAEGKNYWNETNEHPFAIYGINQALFTGVHSQPGGGAEGSAYLQSIVPSSGAKGGISFNAQGGNVRVGNPGVVNGIPFGGWAAPVKFGVDGFSYLRGGTWADGPLAITNNGEGPGEVLTTVGGTGLATWEPAFSLTPGGTTGDVLVWDATTGTWGPGGAVTPNGLAHGDTLWWDASVPGSEKWIAHQNLRNDGNKIEANGAITVSGGQNSAEFQVNAEGNASGNDWWGYPGSGHPFAIQGNNEKLLIGVDSNLSTSYLQGVDNNIKASAITLNRQGGNIYLGDLFAQNMTPANNSFASFTLQNIFTGSTSVGMMPDPGFKFSVDGGTASPLNGILSIAHGGPWSYGILSKVSDPYVKALAVQDTSMNITPLPDTFRVYGNGETFAAGKLTVDIGTNSGDIVEFNGDGNVNIKPGEDTGQVVVGQNTTFGVPLVVNGNIYAVTPNSPQSSTGYEWVAEPAVSCGTSAIFTTSQAITHAQFTNNNYLISEVAGVPDNQLRQLFIDSCWVGPHSSITQPIVQNYQSGPINSTLLLDSHRAPGCAVPTPPPMGNNTTSQYLTYDDCQQGSYTDAQPVSPPIVYELYTNVEPTNPDQFCQTCPVNQYASLTVTPMVRPYRKIATQVTGEQGNIFGRDAKLSALADDPTNPDAPGDNIPQNTCSDDNGWLIPCGALGGAVDPGTEWGQTLRWDSIADKWVVGDHLVVNGVSVRNDGNTFRILKEHSGTLSPQGSLYSPTFSATKSNGTQFPFPYGDGLVVDSIGQTKIMGSLNIGSSATLGSAFPPVDPSSLRVWGSIDVKGGITNGEDHSPITNSSGFPNGGELGVKIIDPLYVSGSVGVSGGIKAWYGDIYSGGQIFDQGLAHGIAGTRIPVCTDSIGKLVFCDTSSRYTIYTTTETAGERFQTISIPAGIDFVRITAVGAGAGGMGGKQGIEGGSSGKGGSGGGSGGFVSNEFAVGPNQPIHNDAQLYVISGRPGSGGGYSSSSCTEANGVGDATINNINTLAYPVTCGGMGGLYGHDGTGSYAYIVNDPSNGGTTGSRLLYAKGGKASTSWPTGGQGGGALAGNGGVSSNGRSGGNGGANSDDEGDRGGGGGAGGAAKGGPSTCYTGQGSPFSPCINGESGDIDEGGQPGLGQGGVGEAGIVGDSYNSILPAPPSPDWVSVLLGSSNGGNGGRGGKSRAYNQSVSDGDSGSPASNYGGGGGGGGGGGRPGFAGGNIPGGSGGKGSEGIMIVELLDVI
jgi:hypothetical protein